MDALASMEVGKRTGDVGCKGKSETPGQRLGFVVDVLAKVTWEACKIRYGNYGHEMPTILDKFGDDKDATIRLRSTRKSKIEDDIGVPRLSVRRAVRYEMG